METNEVGFLKLKVLMKNVRRFTHLYETLIVKRSNVFHETPSTGKAIARCREMEAITTVGPLLSLFRQHLLLLQKFRVGSYQRIKRLRWEIHHARNTLKLDSHSFHFPPHPASTPIVYYAERLHLLGLDRAARFLVDAVHLLVWHTDGVHDLVVLLAVQPLLLLGLGHAQTHSALQRNGDENGHEEGPAAAHHDAVYLQTEGGGGRGKGERG